MKITTKPNWLGSKYDEYIAQNVINLLQYNFLACSKNSENQYWSI